MILMQILVVKLVLAFNCFLLKPVQQLTRLLLALLLHFKSQIFILCCFLLFLLMNIMLELFIGKHLVGCLDPFLLLFLTLSFLRASQVLSDVDVIIIVCEFGHEGVDLTVLFQLGRTQLGFFGSFCLARCLLLFLLSFI